MTALKATPRAPIIGRALAEQGTTDDLFSDEPSRQQPLPLPLVAKPITCRACGLYAPAVARGILLCQACGERPEATRAHVAEVAAKAETAFSAASDRLDTLLARADEATHTRWGRVEAALAACNGMPDARLARSLELTRQLGDSLSAILLAYDAVRVATRVLIDARLRAAAARSELDALCDAL